MTALDVPAATARPRAGAVRPAAYRADVASAWPGTAGPPLLAPTPFQAPLWLGSWYDAMAGRPGLTPLVITVREDASGDLALRLPLVLRRTGGLRAVEFADLDLTDYNAPLLGPAAPVDRAGAARLVRAVRRALPPADLLRLAKMPGLLKGRPNPLALLPAAVPCALNGNVVITGDDYDAWRFTLERTVRKELERSWRVFSKAPGAAFVRVTDPADAKDMVATLEAQQGDRMKALGSAYVLDDPDFSRFYRAVAERGLADGSALVTALVADGEVVASLLGIRDPESYVMVRISQAGGRWSNCSPGRLVIERTMAALHGEGCRTFDFSIGNYDYKRRFGVVPTPLVDYVAALGPRGIPAALRAAAVGRLRDHPALDARLRRLRALLSRRG